MKVSIVGVGYVGLVTGVCLAEKGHRVICVDIDSEKVNKINRGVSPIYEKDLDALLNQTIHRTLTATTDLEKAVLETDISIIAVGTPQRGGEIDLTYIREAARLIGEVLGKKNTYHLVVVKSTVIPGTTDQVVLPILEKASGKKAGADFGVSMNPEFLREGEAIVDFMHPDRIVLGGMDARSVGMLEDLYRPFSGVDQVKTNNRTAEMIKYASNSLFATMISYANEIGNLCADLGGVDVADVMKAVHLDKRLSPILLDGQRITPSFTTYLEAGCGFGGSCFPKDLTAIIACARAIGRPMLLLEAVVKVNQEQPQQVLSLLAKHVPSVKGLSVAVLGLAFKPETDDIRESPAIPIIQSLLEQGAKIRAHDPIANANAKAFFKDAKIRYCDQLTEAIQDVDAILVLTRWEEYKAVPDLLKKSDRQPLLIDGRRMFDRSAVERYLGVGWDGLSKN